ncbi:hypothetical protein ACVIIV_001901 [Bradyrhizobium sp. USDA 4354]
MSVWAHFVPYIACANARLFLPKYVVVTPPF